MGSRTRDKELVKCITKFWSKTINEGHSKYEQNTMVYICIYVDVYIKCNGLYLHLCNYMHI